MKRPDWLERITGLCYQVGDCRDIQLLLAHCDELRAALEELTLSYARATLLHGLDDRDKARDLLNRTSPPQIQESE